MIDKLHQFLTSVEGSIYANWLSLILTIGGFTWTIIVTYRSTRAAERAALAAQEALDATRRFDTVQNLSKAISALEEIKRLHNLQVWNALPDRYTTVRLLLVELHIANPHLSDTQNTAVQGIISQLASMEGKIQKSLSSDLLNVDIATLNRFLIQQMDKLTQILAEIRTGVTR